MTIKTSREPARTSAITSGAGRPDNETARPALADVRSIAESARVETGRVLRLAAVAGRKGAKVTGAWLKSRLGNHVWPPKISRLGWMIILMNLAGLAVMLGAIIFFSPYQAHLINAQREALLAQGNAIAAAISDTVVARNERVQVDPDLLDLGQSEELAKAAKEIGSLRFPLRSERVGPLLRRVMSGTTMRARVFSTEGDLIVDSDPLLGIPRAASTLDPNPAAAVDSLQTRISDWFDGSDLPVYKDIGATGKAHPGVTTAAQGEATTMLLLNERGKRMVAVSVPIRRADARLGVLVLTTREGALDKLLWRERRSVLWLSAFGLLGMGISAWLLSRWVARPLSELAGAAERVQKNIRRREELPDLSSRQDEIGHLSTTLRAMTATLYQRIEASERFAEDVAHELKNPLTSVRSATETLALVKTEEDRKHFINTIQDDVRRLTRLIDDISKATRMSAEMALNEAMPVDLRHLLGSVAEAFQSFHLKHEQQLQLEVSDERAYQAPYVVIGHDMRLGQVFKNLLDNALSFSPPTGRVWIKASRHDSIIRIQVDDEGPGIPQNNLEHIFERFYTDRPVASFGNNSGLGLAICREIVLAHSGRIWAENRLENSVQRTGTSELGVVTSRCLGARFTVELPAASGVAGHRRRALLAR